MTEHRFFIDPISITENHLETTDRELLHRLRVTRITVGEKVEIFNQQEAYLAELIEVTKRHAYFSILQKNTIPLETKPKIFLIQSILKSQAMDDVIEKTTELGISGIIPCSTLRVVPRIGNNRAKRDRWQKLVLPAVIRSDRYSIPTIYDITPLNALDESLHSIALIQGSRIFKIVFNENEKEMKLADVMQNKNYDVISIMIGPEGGFESSEVKALEALGFISTQFSERVLTADVAAIGAVTLVQYLIGRL
jgi:16S rRNA (uracil1498-N3)-methyltransferase